jgi:hypothetical protein
MRLKAPIAIVGLGKLGQVLASGLVKIEHHLVEGFSGDLNHLCMGRSAPYGLENALAFANDYHLAVPTLRAIAYEIGLCGEETVVNG